MSSILLTSAVEIEKQVAGYQALSMGFFIGGCICLLAAVGFFGWFRIDRILAIKTGHARRRSIKEMEGKNTEPLVFSEGGEETTLLAGKEEWAFTGQTAGLGEKEIKPSGRFVILRDITFLHTEEQV